MRRQPECRRQPVVVECRRQPVAVGRRQPVVGVCRATGVRPEAGEMPPELVGFPAGGVPPVGGVPGGGGDAARSSPPELVGLVVGARLSAPPPAVVELASRWWRVPPPAAACRWGCRAAATRSGGGGATGVGGLPGGGGVPLPPLNTEFSFAAACPPLFALDVAEVDPCPLPRAAPSQPLRKLEPRFALSGAAAPGARFSTGVRSYRAITRASVASPVHARASPVAVPAARVFFTTPLAAMPRLPSRSSPTRSGQRMRQRRRIRRSPPSPVREGST